MPQLLLLLVGLGLTCALVVSVCDGFEKEMSKSRAPGSALAPAPRPEELPGITEAYQTVAGKLQDQLSQIDALDTKLGVVIAALGVGTVAFLIADFGVIARGVLGGLLLASLIFAVSGFAVGKYRDAPESRAYARWATASPEEMHRVFIPNLLQALDENAVKLVAKGRLLNLSAILITVDAIVAVVGRIARLG